MANYRVINTLPGYEVRQRLSDGKFYCNLMVNHSNTDVAYKDRRTTVSLLQDKTIADALTKYADESDIDIRNGLDQVQYIGNVFERTTGQYQKTYMHPCMFILFAQWLDPNIPLKDIKKTSSILFDYLKKTMKLNQ